MKGLPGYSEGPRLGPLGDIVDKGGKGMEQSNPHEDTGSGSQWSFQVPGSPRKAKGKPRQGRPGQLRQHRGSRACLWLPLSASVGTMWWRGQEMKRYRITANIYLSFRFVSRCRAGRDSDRRDVFPTALQGGWSQLFPGSRACVCHREADARTPRLSAG